MHGFTTSLFLSLFFIYSCLLPTHAAPYGIDDEARYIADWATIIGGLFPFLSFFFLFFFFLSFSFFLFFLKRQLNIPICLNIGFYELNNSIFADDTDKDRGALSALAASAGSTAP